MNPLEFLSVYLVATAADIAFAFHIRRVAEGRALAAGIWSSLIAVGSAYATVEYIHHPANIVAVAMAYFTGTYAVVSWESRAKEDE